MTALSPRLIVELMQVLSGVVVIDQKKKRNTIMSVVRRKAFETRLGGKKQRQHDFDA
jgi:hypothetical protein